MAKLAINGGDKAIERSLGKRWPVVDEDELEALVEVIRSGRWWAGGEGSKVCEFEDAASQVFKFCEFIIFLIPCCLRSGSLFNTHEEWPLWDACQQYREFGSRIKSQMTHDAEGRNVLQDVKYSKDGEDNIYGTAILIQGSGRDSCQ